MFSTKGVEEVISSFESFVIQQMGIRRIPWDGMVSSGIRVRVWSELHRDGGKEVVFWDVGKTRWFHRAGDGGFEASDTGIVVRGEFGEKRGKDGGFVGNWKEGGRKEDVVDVGTVDGCGDGSWARMRNGKGRVQGVWWTKKEMKDGVGV